MAKRCRPSCKNRRFRGTYRRFRPTPICRFRRFRSNYVEANKQTAQTFRTCSVGSAAPTVGSVPRQYAGSAGSACIQVKQTSKLCRFRGMMLHETAVSWLRHRLETSLPGRPWEETQEAFGARLRTCCADVNANLDVEGLCRSFRTRVQALVDNQGGRFKE